MPSNRYRSRKSLGSRINRVRSSATRSEATATPSSVGISTVSSDALAKSAVIQDAIAVQSIDSSSLGVHAYQPSGETAQRVPAPLTDFYYWTKVTEGLIELHASGVHGDTELEDIQLATATKDGILLSPSETEKARIYLTGRLPIPKSEKIYAEWASNTEVNPRLVYWNTTPEYLVESAKKADGLSYFNIDSNSSVLSVGSTIKVTETTPDFDSLYKVVRVEGDTVQAAEYETASAYDIADSSYNAITQTMTFVINQPELLQNPSLDSNVTSWTVSDGTIAYTNSQAYSGAGSMLITENVSQSANLPVVSSNVSIRPLKTYTGKFYLKAPVGISAVAKLTEFDSLGNPVETSVSVPVAMTNSWKELAISREMTANANTAAISLSLSRELVVPSGTTFTFDSNVSGWNSTYIPSAQVNTSVVRTGSGSALLSGIFSSVGVTGRPTIIQGNVVVYDQVPLSVGSISVQSDGKAIIGGMFSQFRGDSSYRFIARLQTNGDVDSTFKPNIDAHVYQSAIQTDGSIVIVGPFTSVNGFPVGTNGGIARLTSSGLMDSTFTTNIGSGFNVVPVTVGILSTGRIIVGGQFSTFNGSTVNRIICLNADGTQNTAFTANTTTTAATNAADVIQKLVIQPDDKIVCVGGFGTFNGLSANGIVRINSNGTTDTAFRTNTGTGVGSITTRVASVALQSDGKIILVGDFTTFNGATVNGIVRLNSDGTRDTAFTTNTGTGFPASSFFKTGQVDGWNSLAVQSDGKILIGGAFSSFNGTSCTGLIRLNSDGTIDTSFLTNLGDGLRGHAEEIYAVAVRSDGKILVGGSFSSLNGKILNRIALLNSDGSLNESYTAYDSYGSIGGISDFDVQPDGKILFAGNSEYFRGTSARKVFRINTDDSLDTAFTANVGTKFARQGDGQISAVAVGNANSIVLAGTFTTYNSNTRNRILELNSDGTEDLTFSTNIGTGASNTIREIEIQSDGKIVAGGTFTSFNGLSANAIVRLNTDGNVDTVFRANVGNAFRGSANVNAVNGIAIQSDGKIVVVGDFTTFNSVAANSIVRLNSNGSRDTTFIPGLGFNGASRTLSEVAVDSSGRILVSGSFALYNATAVTNFVRLNSNGTLDTTFNTNLGTGFSAQTDAITIQPDGKILVANGGTLNGFNSKGLYRLNSNGTPDTAFNNAVAAALNANTTINQIYVYPSSGKILVAGAFGTADSFYSSNPVSAVVRLNSDGSFDSNFYSDVFLAEYYSYIPNVQPNVTYGFSAYVRAASGNTNAVAIIREFSDANATVEIANTQSSPVAIVTNAWSLVSVNHSFSNSVQAASFSLALPVGQGAESVYLDDAQLRISPYGSSFYLDEASVKDTTYFDSLSEVDISSGDFAILEEAVGAEELAGGYTVASVDSTSNTSQVVFTANASTTESRDNFYNNSTVYILRGGSTDTVNEQNFSPFGKLFEDEYYYINLDAGQVWSAKSYSHTITAAELSLGLATITSSTSHYALPGDEIEVLGLDISLGLSTTVFDGKKKVVSVLDSKTLTYSTTGSDVPAQNITTGVPIFIRRNQYTPKEYAVYLEAEANTSPVLYSLFKVFEVLGETATVSGISDINTFALTNNTVTLTLNSMPSILTPEAISSGYIKKYTVSIDPASLSGANASNFNGEFVALSADLSTNTITYSVTHANIASEPVTGTATIEVGSKHSELNPGGLNLYDEAGRITSRINSLEYNTFSVGPARISADGNAKFGSTSVGGTIDVEGEANFKSVATFNQDLEISSPLTNSVNNLYGSYDQAKYHVVSDVSGNIIATTANITSYSGDILNRFARGLIYSVRLAEANTTNHLLSTLYGAFGAGSFKLEKDRNYLFVISTGSTRVNTATNVDVRLEFVLTNTAPTFDLLTNATPSFAKKVQIRGGTTGTYSDMVLQYTSVDTAVSPINDGGANVAADYRIAADRDIYWMVRWATTTTTRTPLNFSRINPDKNAFFNIYDMGPSSPALVGNMDADSGNWQTTGTATFATSGNTVVTKTVTFNATATRAREGTGTYVDNDPIYQSHLTNPDNPRKSQIIFPAWSTVPILQEDINKTGFTVNKLELKLNIVDNYWNYRLYFGVSGSTNTGNVVPSPISGSPVANLAAQLSGASFYDISLLSSYFQSGSARSVLVGLENSTTNNYVRSTIQYYAIAGQTSSSDTNVQMRVTYSYILS